MGAAEVAAEELKVASEEMEGMDEVVVSGSVGSGYTHQSIILLRGNTNEMGGGAQITL